MCEHKNFKVMGTNFIGEGTCLDCGSSVGLDDLFNGLIDRCQRVLLLLERLTNSRPNISEEKLAFLIDDYLECIHMVLNDSKHIIPELRKTISRNLAASIKRAVEGEE